ncbi:hypothetical protein [Halobacterium zhouii]|uniref:hypothetical protein n=1 Tax=Halobacterium zhouii TaxID=2902624 RepID=UPI001E318D8F|nr:hypothetical protein [Halobacterium zhouii]
MSDGGVLRDVALAVVVLLTFAAFVSGGYYNHISRVSFNPVLGVGLLVLLVGAWVSADD